MKAARADHSGVFSGVTLSLAKAPTMVQPQGLCVSEKGLTFRSGTRLAPWTEVDVELELPSEVPIKCHRIHCKGVVVECRPAQASPGYDVTLLFIELGRRSLSELTKFSKLHSLAAAPRSAAFASARV